MAEWRRTELWLLPAELRPARDGYDPWPTVTIEGEVRRGIPALAQAIDGGRVALLDGWRGVLWAPLVAGLRERLPGATFLDVSDALLPQAAVDALVEPWLGGDDPLFGTRSPAVLADWFDPSALERLAENASGPGSVVVYGTGAALLAGRLAGPAPWIGFVDVPRNEVQFRQRAGSVAPLGAGEPPSPKDAYKRTYFVDWPVLRRHLAGLLPLLDAWVDGQRPDDPTILAGNALRAALLGLASRPFRPRPWFEPGPWGGQWIRRHVPLPAECPTTPGASSSSPRRTASCSPTPFTWSRCRSML